MARAPRPTHCTTCGVNELPERRGDDECVTCWAERTTAESRLRQGLPRHVEDPVALDRLATILHSAGYRAPDE